MLNNSTTTTEVIVLSDYQLFQISRSEAYPPIEHQLDLMYWDKVNGTTNWQDLIASIKDSVPASY